MEEPHVSLERQIKEHDDSTNFLWNCPQLVVLAMERVEGTRRKGHHEERDASCTNEHHHWIIVSGRSQKRNNFFPIFHAKYVLINCTFSNVTNYFQSISCTWNINKIIYSQIVLLKLFDFDFFGLSPGDFFQYIFSSFIMTQRRWIE